VAEPRPRFSLRLNNDVPVAEFVELAQLAESLEFDQIWISHDLFFRAAPVLLSAAAVATTRISLGTCVLNPYSLHPAEIAMTAATLQELSDGRFLLGLAAGAEDFLAWAGIARRRPLRTTREAVVAIRALCSGVAPADIVGAGVGWRPDGRLRVPAAPTPIYLGAMSPRMLELIGEVADGGLPLLYPPESFAAAAGHVHAGCARAGRAPGDVDLAACIWVSVDRDAGRAQRPLAEKLAYYGPSFAPGVLASVGVEHGALAKLRHLDPAEAAAALPPAMMSLGLSGAPEEIVARCGDLVAAGAEHVSFGPPLGPDRRAAVRLLGEDVVPALRARRR
jgi:5,10-methylenetetrahydromethanopterin reductase